MPQPGPTLDSSATPRLLAWVLLGGILLWPRPALASGFEPGPQWIGAGLALGLFLLVVLAAAWILRSPSSKDMESGSGTVSPPIPAAAHPVSADFRNTRLGRLQEGLGRRRRALKQGSPGFTGDTAVMARFLEGCGRIQRGQAPPVPPGRKLPPGTLTRLTRLYDQLLSATPGRAKDWPLQRTSLSSQIRTTLGQRDTLRFLELLDGLAKRRVERQGPTPEEAAGWSAFLAQFRDTPQDPAPLASSPDSELAIAEDVPTSVLGADLDDAPTVDSDHLFPTGNPAEAEDAPTVGTDHLFPAGNPAEAEDAPTVDTDHLFPTGNPAEAEDAPTVDTDHLFPTGSPVAEAEDAPTVDTDRLFPAKPHPEEDAPTVDTDRLFPAEPHPAEDAPTVDTENLFPADPEENAPTVDTESLFPAEPHPDEGPPTVDTDSLFSSRGDPAPTAPPKRRRPRPARASFRETNELLDPVEDAPTRDTAELFRKE